MPMEFHVSRRARDRYRFDETLFALDGNVIFANFHAARLFAQRMNEKRDLVRFPEQAVKAGEINAMGLLDELLHLVVARYHEQKNPEAMRQALEWLYERLGRPVVDEALRRFVDEFPPVAVYRGEIDPETYLEGETDGVPHRQRVLEELLMLWLANANPALAPFAELFDDAALEKETAYRQLISELRAFFDTQPPFGPDEQNLVEMLHTPAEVVPHSLWGQLEYIRERWGYLLGRHLYRLLRSLDLMREEERMAFLGPGPARVYEFGALELEPERYSPDRLISELRAFFDTQPPFGPDEQNLVEMLHTPAEVVPHSLWGQLEYIRERWGYLLGRHLYRLLRSLDLMREEERMAFLGPGPARVYEFGALELEPERYSPDRDWMPRLVLMAKNTYVWLDQLSKQYRRPITRLDQIPDEELDTLARWGITGLWLIGVWERSRASQRIKQLCGNPEAVASAYSLFDYEIAADLGGEAAFQDLKARAWQRGIRLASDMVPNHMGIDSKWVMEHPDWFISVDQSPFPSYTFNGPDLSWHPDVGIYLEDHYYTRTDAAVVFKRVDRRTGTVRYIYHGNDGTGMPWNDTAQLNYLKPEVREAVIQTILHVARKFPIIRFDAAMTLTKKHYQRLWFPEPGMGGAIPSRAEHGMTREEFDRHMPQEFWREVVDRVAQEAPDTLLLAEAFWLMEGYFVRTLGMHRVYNSAFMNMLRDEENANYRSVMKNTLEFDPQILKRFVNFMNNPDEETAVAQFGKGDKYFGVCTMMVTLPGLPMFGHGQVEGFAEKYGMEYRRAYWDEQPDPHLIARHEREIFPLLRRRHLFAGVENFLLYDFFTPEGHVNEDVFAYSNRAGAERALVVYHNRYAETRGWIRTSVAYAEKGPDGERRLVQKTLAEGLGLRRDGDTFCIFRDHVTGLEYIRSNRELWEQGLYLELGAYEYHVFLDFREVQDDAWHHYANLAAYLDGRGVPSIAEALRETFLQPVHHAFEALVNAGSFRRLMAARVGEAMPERREDLEALLGEMQGRMVRLLGEAKRYAGGAGDETVVAREVRDTLEALLRLPALEQRFPDVEAPDFRTATERLRAHLGDDPFTWGCALSWVFVHRLGKAVQAEGYEELSRSWIDEWLLGRIIAAALQALGLDDATAWRGVGLVRLLTGHQRWFETLGTAEGAAPRLLEALLQDADAQQFLGVNRHQGVLWFNREAAEELLTWLLLTGVVATMADPERSHSEQVEAIAAQQALLDQLAAAAHASGYRVEEWLAQAGSMQLA